MKILLEIKRFYTSSAQKTLVANEVGSDGCRGTETLFEDDLVEVSDRFEDADSLRDILSFDDSLPSLFPSWFFHVYNKAQL